MTRTLLLSWAVILCLTLPVAAQTRGFTSKSKVSQTPFVNGAYRALVIGNNVYKDPHRIWKPLKTAIADAEAVANILQKDYGFGAVKLLKNATRREMIQAFNQITKEAGENDSVLIYYAGHGYLREETQEGYWIPVDAEGADDSTFIPNPVIKTKLSVIADRAKHVVLISDSCFSGALLRQSNRGVRLDEKSERYYRKMAQRKSVQILAAGGVEFVDDNYRNTGHSPFTYFLLEALRLPDSDLVEASTLFTEVTRNVAINVNQTPSNGVLSGAGHAGGEFFLLRGGVSGEMLASNMRGSSATGPSGSTQAFLPGAALPALAAPGLAAGGGGLGLPFWSGGGLLLFSVIQFKAASDSHNEAAGTADSNPQRSKELEEDRDSAFSTAVVAGLAGAGMLAWWYWSGGDAVTSTDTWRVAPLVASHVGNPVSGVILQRRW